MRQKTRASGLIHRSGYQSSDAIIDRQSGIGRLKKLWTWAKMKDESDHRERDIARPIEVAREVARLVRSVLGEDAEVIWFGSWPQGKALPHSDIDVAISIGEPIAPERMGLLQEALDGLPTLFEIDIMDLNATGPALRDEILKHGERL